MRPIGMVMKRIFIIYGELLGQINPGYSLQISYTAYSISYEILDYRPQPHRKLSWDP